MYRRNRPPPRAPAPTLTDDQARRLRTNLDRCTQEPPLLPVTLDNYRKHKVQTELAGFVGEEPIPSQQLLQELLEKDFFAISSEHGRANRLVIEWAAGLRLQPAWRAYPSVEEFCKANADNKAYVPCQRDLSQPLDVRDLPALEPGELLVVQKDRTLLRCRCAGPLLPAQLWTTEIAGVLDETLVRGMLKTNCKPELSTGLPMCCDFARNGYCLRARCSAAHVVDGRPCEHDGCPTHPGLVTITIPFRVAEFYGWLREEDGLPLLGVQQDASLVMRLPGTLLGARTEREFHPELTRFLDHINPRLPSRKKNEKQDFTDAEYADNVRKYFLALATSVYRKWQEAAKQPTRLSAQNAGTQVKLAPLYPASWSAMIAGCNARRAPARPAAGVHQPYACAAVPEPAPLPTPLVARPPVAPVVPTVAPPAVAERSVTNPRLSRGAAEEPAAADTVAPRSARAAAAGAAAPPQRVLALFGYKKCNSTPTGRVAEDAAFIRKDWYSEKDKQKVSGPAEAWVVEPGAQAQ